MNSIRSTNISTFKTFLRVAVILFCLHFFSFSLNAESVKWAVVSTPVTDLRSVAIVLPGDATSYAYDSFQETQLLYGEIVKVFEEENFWLKVEAIEQPEFSHNNRWQGYPGWIKKNSVTFVKKVYAPNFVVQKKVARLFSAPDIKTEIMELSLGTKIIGLNKVKNGFRKVKIMTGKSAWMIETDIRPSQSVLSEELTRKKIIEAASELLGDPYYWGGRSAHIPELKNQVTAADCSGLVNLAYRVAGIEIPRDSIEQFMKANKISREQLKTGDLIFSASSETPDKISHVSIYVDEQNIIEAPKTGEIVHQIEFEKKFGVPISEIKEGEPVGERIIYFGTYF